MVQIKFTKFGANSAFGGFAPGDTLRISEQMARHLVEEIGVAKYVEKKVEPVAEPVAETAPVAAPAPARKSKAK